MPNPLNLLCIFRPGNHTDQHGTTLTFTESDLSASAAAYDPTLHQAPLVVGHPTTDAPAWGWVKSLAVTGGRLLATPDQVDPAFAEMVNAGRYNKISASFYLPNAPNNPVPGTYYLRHVGFLGAQPPAIKGLGSAKFAGAEEGVVTLEFSEIFQSTAEKEPIMPDTKPPATDDSAAIAKAQQELAEKQAAFAEKEQKFLATVTAARAKEDVAFVEGLVKEGKILPLHKPPLLAFLASVGEADQLSFAEEGQTVQKPSREWLKGFLAATPKRVSYGEHAGPGSDPPAPPPTHLPPGYRVDPDQAETMRQALAYAATNKVDFVTAVQAIERGASQ